MYICLKIWAAILVLLFSLAALRRRLYDGRMSMPLVACLLCNNWRRIVAAWRFFVLQSLLM